MPSTSDNPSGEVVLVADGDCPDPGSQKSALAQKLEVLYSEILERVGSVCSNFRSCDPDGKYSRDNLLAYLVLRDHDLQEVQLELADLGLSSLGRLEGNVLASLQHVMGHVGATQAKSSGFVRPTFAGRVTPY
jgi:hypothetical protein